ncbi:MAG: polyprenyl synthetase family protein [candidate division FCPU426 bacterium]
MVLPGAVRFLTLKPVDQRLRRLLKAPDPFLRRLLDLAGLTRGKRVRAQLTLLSAAACGRVTPAAQQLAAVLELFHAATLLHDDVLDGAGQRRHQRTLNAHFGNAVAVLAGDYLFTQVMRAAFGGLPTRVQELLASTAQQVCLGEIAEQRHRGRLNLTPAQYQRIIERKTASLFAACGAGGAMLAKGSPGQVESLRRFGMKMGLAFQIQDDLLDLTGRQARLGKPVGADFQTGHLTLPVILGLRQLRGAQRRALQRSLRQGAAGQAAVRRLLAGTAALVQTAARSQALVRLAERELDCFKESQVKRGLLALARMAVERDR